MDRIQAFGLGLIAMALVVAFGFLIAYTTSVSIAGDCKRLGRFSVDQQVYECRPLPN